MLNRRLLWPLLVAALFVAQASVASAQWNTITSPHGTAAVNVYAGSWANFGQVVLIQNKATSQCQGYWVGGASGLSGDTGVVIQNNASDTIFLDSSSACGLSLKPLLYNGYQFAVLAGGGNDVFYGGRGGGTTAFFGEEGHDDIWLPIGPWSVAFGGAGNDELYGSSSITDMLFGEGGNDSLCEVGSAFNFGYFGSGGEGTDCSYGAFSYLDTVENPNSPNCCLILE